MTRQRVNHRTGGRTLYVLVGASLLAASVIGAGLTGGSQPSLVPDGLPIFSPTPAPSATPSAVHSNTVSGAQPGSITGTFTRTGTMHDGREQPSATLLGDGRVLVVGGYGAGSGTFEIYDPASGKFSLGGSLLHRRYGHNAILLADGRVLVVGGMDPDANSGDGTAFAIPELESWDPATNRFTSAGTLIEARTQAQLTLRSDGRVLVAGGEVWNGSGSQRTDSAEVWDPIANEVERAPSVPVAPAEEAVVTRLLDGRTLIITGSDVSIWDPASETSTQTGRPVGPRIPYTTTATLLGDGRVLVVGGRPTGGGEAIPVAEIWDPRTGEFRTTGSTVRGRRQHSAVRLADGRVLVLGNSISGGGTTSAEIFELGARQLVILVNNMTKASVDLFVAEDGSPMGQEVGTAVPSTIPTMSGREVVFTVPSGQGWAIFVDPGPDGGGLISARDVPPDASGALPFTIWVDEGVEPIVVGPGGERLFGG